MKELKDLGDDPEFQKVCADVFALILKMRDEE
jgi:hypothetical protein